MNQVVDFINVNRDRYVEELKQYLAIPSISALPQHAADVRRARRVDGGRDAQRRPRRTSRLIETPGNPVVYGDWLGAPGKPTILFYGHYDVQPVDPVDLWTSAAVRGDGARRRDLRARRRRRQGPGVHAHQGGRGAPEAGRQRCRCNIKFFIEGEEEVGSVHLDDFVRVAQAGPGRRRRRHLRLADVRPRHPVDLLRPARPAYFQIDLRGTKSDLHSGSFGGAVANPAFVLAQVLAQMKDRSGRIKIPGLLRRRARAERGGARGVEEAAVQRDAVPQGAGRAEAVRRDRLLDARARLGAADVRGERPAVRASPARARRRCCRRRRWRRSACGSCRIRTRTRSRDLFEAYLKKVCPEDRGAEADAHARRQAVDDRVRQQVRARRRPRDRAGLRQGAGLQPRRRLDSRSSRRSRRSSACRACCSASGCPTRTPTRPTRSWISATSTTASSRRRTCTRRSQILQ